MQKLSSGLENTDRVQSAALSVSLQDFKIQAKTDKTRLVVKVSGVQ